MKPHDTISFVIEENFYSPAYSKVAEFLQNNIRNGIFKHGASLPPEPALAEKLGVSRVTLRHALKNLEQKGLIIRRRGRSGGNFICIPGKGNPVSRTFGIVCNLKNPNREPYFLDILEGIQSQLGEKANLFLTSTIGDNILDFYNANHLDGVLIINPSVDNADLFNSLLLEAIPHVIISMSTEHIKNDKLVSVDTDNRTGSIAAMQYLMRLGHTRIAYIGSHVVYSNSMDRLNGYEKALEENKIEIDSELIHIKGKAQEYDGFARNAVKVMLTLKNPPTAIFAAGFTMAMETILALEEAGLKVPEDVSVLGFDDFEPSINVHKPFLTTVRQPLVELGQNAARKIMEWINTGNVKEKQLILQTELIIRNSCSKIKQG